MAQPAGTAISAAVTDEHGFLSHEVQSPYQAGTTQIKVLLPDQRKPGKKYRVLYVLPVVPGYSDRYGPALLEIRKHGFHNKDELIAVFPTFSDWPWYCDHPTDPLIRQETYFLNVVVPFIDREYPTLARPDGRLLLGFSKSGYGAFTLLLRHPDEFGKAVAWDSPLNWKRPSEQAMTIFGTQENFERYRIPNLLRRAAGRLGRQPRLLNFSAGGSMGPQHEAIHELMDGLRIPQRYIEGPPRRHRWDSGWVPEAVRFLAGGR